MGSACIQKEARIELCRIKNIPPTKAGISQSRDTNFRLHNTTRDLPLSEGIASVFVQANKSNQTNFRTKTRRPKFRCSLLETFDDNDLEFQRRVWSWGNREEVERRHNVRGETYSGGLAIVCTQKQVTYDTGYLRSYFFTMHCTLRLIVRSELDVPTFTTRRLHARHHARAPSGRRRNCGREMSGNFT